MTISSNVRKVGPFTGTGTVTVFTFNFKVFQASDLYVVKADSDGIETVLVLNTDYTASLNSNQDSNPGGSITLASALATGYTMIISSTVGNLQPTDLTNQGGFYPSVITDALDRATIQIQQLQESVDRSAKLPITNGTDAAQLTADILLLANNKAELDVLYANINDIQTVAADLNEPVSEINTVAGSITNVNIVGNDIANVNTVAGNTTNINTVAGNTANVTTVAGISGNVTTVAGISANVTAVANNATNINAVNANKANIDAVAGNNTNITAVAGNATNINAVNANKTNIDTVAGKATEVTTVAGIAGNVTTVAGISSNVTTVAGISSSVATAATNVTAINDYSKVWLGGKASDPTLRNDGSALQTGDQYFNTGANKVRVYSTGTSLWVDSGITFSPTVERFSGTGSQTAFTLSSSPGTAMALIVNISGVVQTPTVDYTVSGTTLTFTTAPPSGTNNITVQNFGSAGVINVPADGSVTDIKAATGSKLYNRINEIVSVKDFGAVGNGSTDDLAALVAAEAEAYSRGASLYIPSGTYKITNKFSCRVPIKGDGAAVSVIKNYGTSDALDLSGCGYYVTFQDFSVDGSGNANSRDGISLYNGTSGNVSYCKFLNVHSNNNGRHGLYHRMAWATRYSQCMFTYNKGLGVYCDSEYGDIGTHNAVSFHQCDSRWNGGSTSGFGSDAGGVKILGAAGVQWIGGVVESNNGFGFYIGSSLFATRNVLIQGVYLEDNGSSVSVGGAFYATAAYDNVFVRDCWITYGAGAGNTNYCFCGASSASGIFEEKDNFLYAVGAGTNILYAPGAKTNRYPKQKVSSTFGDTGASGVSVNTTLLAITADGMWTLTGFIYFKRNSDTVGTVRPFIAHYDGNVGRSVSMGSPIVGSSTASPTLAFSGDYLVLTTPAYCYAHVTIEDGGFISSTLFNYNTTIFGPQEMRRK